MIFHTHRLYSAQQCRELDQLAIEGSADEVGIPSYQLMQRAAQAVFEFSQLKYPHAHVITVITGAGNNAGDGYLYAKLAIEQQLNVNVFSLAEPADLTGDARQAFEDWQQSGGELIEDVDDAIHEADLIIDAILGTGLSRELDVSWTDLIDDINALDTPVIAVDVPSGLHVDTGAVMGAAIEADFTVSFIGLKKGLFTGQARNHCGEIVFNDLAVPPSVYAMFNEEAHLLSAEDLPVILPRKACTHKGQTGHLLIVGGNLGMCGAVVMAAQAALRAGAGRVSVITRPEHVSAVVSQQAEIMVLGLEADEAIPETLLQRVNAVAIGPGLGSDSWASNIFEQVIYLEHHKILDADALLHLPDHAADLTDTVITPHPGEAAAMLNSRVADIEADRYAAIESLYQEYNALTVLKGAGTLIYDGFHQVDVCPYGNPGMASAGMGDILTGVIAALISQGIDKYDAVKLAVCYHALAADQAAEKGQRGLLATDLLPYIRQRVNQ